MIDGLKVFHDHGWALVLPDAEDPTFQIYSEGTTPEAATELTSLYTSGSPLYSCGKRWCSEAPDETEAKGKREKRKRAFLY